MKKLLTLGAIFASLAVLTPVAHATNLGPTNFNVKVDLTAKCTLGVSIPDLDFGTYTAITGGASTASPTSVFLITCTRGLTAPTYTFDAAKGGTDGVIKGLNYTLSAASTEAGVGGSAGTAATPGIAGTAALKEITITGNMPANQAGACGGANAATCAGVTTDVRTLTITY